MPFDDEKLRLEARLIGLLNQALQDRNRDEIVNSTLALGDLYLSGDLYEKAEEYFGRVLAEPVVQLARPDERARAALWLGAIALRRGQVGAARDGLKRAGEVPGTSPAVQAEARRLHCELELYAGRYREVVDTIESTLGGETLDRNSDLRVDLMLLEARARRFMGRHRHAGRQLEKALDLAQRIGYESGTAGAHGELGRLHTLTGRMKQAFEHLEAAIRSDEGTGSQTRLGADLRRLALLEIRMGRWTEADAAIERAYTVSRDLGLFENRIASQMVRAQMRRLRGALDDAYDLALDAMEGARSAEFLRRHVQGLLCLGQIQLDRGRTREALDHLRDAETLYGRVAPESNLMIQLHVLAGRAHDRAGEPAAAFDRLMKASSLARETGLEIERSTIDSYLGEHFRARGEEEKAVELLMRSARELGELGAKFDVARARLSLARLLCDAHMARSLEDRQREMKLARSNLFEARRLFEAMGAAPRLVECGELDAKLQPERPAAAPE